MGVIGLGNIGVSTGRKIIGNSKIVNFGTFTGASAVPYPFLGDTSSFLYDGVDERFYADKDSGWITGSASWSFWFRSTGTDTSDFMLARDNNSTDRRSWLFNRRIGEVRIAIWHTNGTSTLLISAGSNYNDGEWHHVVGTFTGDTTSNGMKLYIDGVLENQATAGASGILQYSPFSDSKGISIGGGGNATPSACFSGNIDEVAIWNGVVLDASDVTTIYNNGLPTDITSLAPTYWWREEYTTWDGSNWMMTEVMETGLDMQSQNMEEGDRVPNVPAWSFLTDGVDEYLRTATNPTFNPVGAFSGSIWVKQVDTVNSLQAIICHDSASGNNRGWLLYFNGTGSNNKHRLFIWNTNGTLNALDGTVGALSDGEWHHIGWTYTGDTTPNGLKLYFDGAFEAQMTTASTGIRTFTGAQDRITVGATASPSFINEAHFMQTALWDGTVLSADNMSDLYNSGFPADPTSLNPDVHWKLGNDATWDGSNWTVSNASNAGTDDLTSINMEEGDRTQDVP